MTDDRSIEPPAPTETPAGTDVGAPVLQAPAPAGAQGFGRRELLMIAAAVAFGGVVMLAWLNASGSRPAEAATRSDAPAGRVSVGAGSTSAAFPTWNSANRDWVGDQRKAVAFELEADHKVQVWQRQAQPILIVRCVASRIDAFVFIESAAQIEARDGDHGVTLRFDDGPGSAERWPDSDEHDALFAPDAASFVQRVAGSRTMQFSYTPHNAPTVTASFHTAGLGQQMSAFPKECEGKPDKRLPSR